MFPWRLKEMFRKLNGLAGSGRVRDRVSKPLHVQQVWVCLDSATGMTCFKLLKANLDVKISPWGFHGSSVPRALSQTDVVQHHRDRGPSDGKAEA